MDAELILGIVCIAVSIPFLLWALKALLEGKDIPIAFVAVVIAFIFGVYTVAKDMLPKFIAVGGNDGFHRSISFPEGSLHPFVFGGHTYCICVRSNIESFQDAERLCEEYGGHLAVINSAEENKSLYDYYIKESGYHSAYFGYSDSVVEGEWEWVDGSPNGREGAYTSWKQDPLQPDNGRVYDGEEGEEDYALFWYLDPEYTWNDGDFGKDKGTSTVIFLIEWDYTDS